MQAHQGTVVCKFGRDPAICLREEAIYVPERKCSYHVTFDLDLDLDLVHTLVNNAVHDRCSSLEIRQNVVIVPNVGVILP